MNSRDEYLNRKIIDKRIYIPYGIEIEAESIPFDNGKRVISHKIDDTWLLKSDDSLIDKGLEISSPVLSNDKDTLVRLKKLAKTLDYLGATFNNASLQLNFDYLNKSDDDIIYLLKVFSIYQNVICRYSTGIDDSLRKSFFDYAIPLGDLFRYRFRTNAIKIDSYRRFINNKSFSLSLKTLTKKNQDPIKVIEFRTPNGSSNYYLWMNYIIFFSSFLTSVNKNQFDRDYVDYSFDHLVFADSLDKLIAIDEDKACELADIIFITDEEKDCFFKQYFDKTIRIR